MTGVSTAAVSLHKPSLHSWTAWLSTYAAGLCMGVADIVPGISGGTIAFILGVYPSLILSLNSFDHQAFRDLFKLDFSSFFKRVGWEFLCALVAGIATSLILLASLIDWLLNQPETRVLLYASFSGLVLASVLFFSREIRQWHLSYVGLFLLGGIAAFFLTTAKPSEVSNTTYSLYFPLSSQTDWSRAENYEESTQSLKSVDKETLSLMLAKGLISSDTQVTLQGQPHPVSSVVTVVDRSWWQPILILSGMLAISAALLPGISGSYLLTILGLYPVVIGALSDFTTSLRLMSWNQEAFLILINFTLGVGLGALLFARFIRWLFNRGPEMAIALLAGFMLGAMPSVWPFWHYRYLVNPFKLQRGLELQPIEPYLPSLDSVLMWQAVGCACFGFCLVFLLEICVKRYYKTGR